MRRAVAFYGGSFNPPHVGHQATILHAIECANVDRLIVAPVYKHPDGKELAPFYDRLHMLDRLCLPFKYGSVEVSDIERRAYEHFGTGYTVDTVKGLLLDEMHHRRSPGANVVVLVLGSDLKERVPQWAGYDELKLMIDTGTVELFWVQRDIPISSTDVRARIAQGLSTQRSLPPRVREYIDMKGLYR